MKKLVVVGLFAVLGGCGSSGGGAGTGGAGGTQAGGRSGGAGGAGATGGGGSGAGGASACGPLTPFTTGSTGTISWRDDGTLVCPLLAIVQRTTSGLVDTFELDSSSASNYAVDIALSSYNGLLNGTYTCQDGNGTTAPYVYLGFISPGGSGMAPSGDCTVNITFTTDGAGVAHAQGTFSGTVAGPAGNETITDGVFDVTVTQSGSGNGGAGGHGVGGAGGGSGAGGDGGVDTQALCTSSCATFATCGVTTKVSCVSDCQSASATYQTCIASAGSDCNAMALCYFQAAARTDCTGGGVPTGAATCAATDTCEGTCNTSGGGAACRCGCLTAASPAVASLVLGVNSCASNICKSVCTGMSSPDCNACYQQMCPTPRSACLAH